MTTTFPRSSSPLKTGSLLLLLAAVIIYVALNIYFPNKHGNRDAAHNATLAEQCLNSHGIYKTIMEPNGRTHLLCLDKVDPTKFYDVIYKVRDIVQGITTFKITEILLKDGTLIKFADIEAYAAFLVTRGDQVIATTEAGPFRLIFPD